MMLLKQLAALTLSNEKKISVLPVLQKMLLKKQRANFFSHPLYQSFTHTFHDLGLLHYLFLLESEYFSPF